MFGDFWVRMWSWWVKSQHPLKKKKNFFRHFQPLTFSLFFSPAGWWYSCGAGVCWSHLSVSHAFHFCQVWWSPGDGLPKRGHRWHHSGVWPHHVSAYPQGRGVLCLLQQVGWTVIHIILYEITSTQKNCKRKCFPPFFFYNVAMDNRADCKINLEDWSRKRHLGVFHPQELIGQLS